MATPSRRRHAPWPSPPAAGPGLAIRLASQPGGRHRARPHQPHPAGAAAGRPAHPSGRCRRPHHRRCRRRCRPAWRGGAVSQEAAAGRTPSRGHASSSTSGVTLAATWPWPPTGDGRGVRDLDQLEELLDLGRARRSHGPAPLPRPPRPPDPRHRGLRQPGAHARRAAADVAASAATARERGMSSAPQAAGGHRPRARPGRRFPLVRRSARRLASASRAGSPTSADGSVEVVAEGPDGLLDELVLQLWEGPLGRVGRRCRRPPRAGPRQPRRLHHPQRSTPRRLRRRRARGARECAASCYRGHPQSPQEIRCRSRPRRSAPGSRRCRSSAAAAARSSSSSRRPPPSSSSAPTQPIVQQGQVGNGLYIVVTGGARIVAGSDELGALRPGRLLR